MKELRFLWLFVFTSNILVASENGIQKRDLLHMKDMVSRITLQRKIIVGQKIFDPFCFTLEIGTLYAGVTFLGSDSLSLIGLMGPIVCQWAAQARWLKEDYQVVAEEFNEIKKRWAGFKIPYVRGSKKRALWRARYEADQSWIDENREFLNIRFKIN